MWVLYYLTAEEQDAACERPSRFFVDERTSSGVEHADYTNSGYDRGHLAPNGPIGERYGCEAQHETFLLSNIVPQLPSLNQKTWLGLEELESTSFSARFGGIWSIAGPTFSSEDVERRYLCTGIEIPTAFYKIIVRRANNTAGIDVLAVLVPHNATPGTRLEEFRVAVDEVERLTGLDFFSQLPADAQSQVESAVQDGSEWLLDTKLDSDFPGAARDTCETDRRELLHAEIE